MIKILWISPYCVHDLANPSAVQVRHMMAALTERQAQVVCLTSTVRTSADPHSVCTSVRGMIEHQREKFYLVDNMVQYIYTISSALSLGGMTSLEQLQFYQEMTPIIGGLKPDLVIASSSDIVTMSCLNLAKQCHIPTAFVLLEPPAFDYGFPDIDVILSTSHTLTNDYVTPQGREAVYLGPFIAITGPLVPSSALPYYLQPALAASAAVAASHAVVTALTVEQAENQADPVARVASAAASAAVAAAQAQAEQLLNNQAKAAQALLNKAPRGYDEEDDEEELSQESTTRGRSASRERNPTGRTAASTSTASASTTVSSTAVAASAPVTAVSAASASSDNGGTVLRQLRQQVQGSLFASDEATAANAAAANLSPDATVGDADSASSSSTSSSRATSANTSSASSTSAKGRGKGRVSKRVTELSPHGVIAVPHFPDLGARDHILMVAPNLENGLGIFVRIIQAVRGKKEVAPYKFAVIESEPNQFVRCLNEYYQKGNGQKAFYAKDFAEVLIYPQGTNFDELLTKTKIMVMPSLAYVSASFTALTAVSFGVSVITTSQATLKEQLGQAATYLDVEQELVDTFNVAPSEEVGEQWGEALLEMIRHPVKEQDFAAVFKHYNYLSGCKRLALALKPLVARKAGNQPQLLRSGALSLRSIINVEKTQQELPLTNSANDSAAAGNTATAASSTTAADSTATAASSTSAADSTATAASSTTAADSTATAASSTSAADSTATAASSTSAADSTATAASSTTAAPSTTAATSPSPDLSPSLASQSGVATTNSTTLDVALSGASAVAAPTATRASTATAVNTTAGAATISTTARHATQASVSAQDRSSAQSSASAQAHAAGVAPEASAMPASCTTSASLSPAPLSSATPSIATNGTAALAPEALASAQTGTRASTQPGATISTVPRAATSLAVNLPHARAVVSTTTLANSGISSNSGGSRTRGSAPTSSSSSTTLSAAAQLHYTGTAAVSNSSMSNSSSSSPLYAESIENPATASELTLSQVQQVLNETAISAAVSYNYFQSATKKAHSTAAPDNIISSKTDASAAITGNSAAAPVRAANATSVALATSAVATAGLSTNAVSPAGLATNAVAPEALASCVAPHASLASNASVADGTRGTNRAALSQDAAHDAASALAAAAAHSKHATSLEAQARVASSPVASATTKAKTKRTRVVRQAKQ